jgi:hypothetical protein
MLIALPAGGEHPAAPEATPVATLLGSHRLTFLSLAGYLAGFYVMPHEWFHLGWLVVGMSLLIIDRGRGGAGIFSSTCILPTAFLAWMVARSLLGSHLQWSSHGDEALRGLAGAGLLVMLFCLVPRLASARRGLNALGPWVVTAAVLAMLTSIFGIPWLAEGWARGQRLSNPLVHGGLNPVVTGLTLSFAAVWCLELGKTAAVGPGTRRLWFACLFGLQLGVFLADSRGAILVLVVGHLVQVFCHGWRRSRAVLASFALAGVLWFGLCINWENTPDPSEQWLASHPMAQQVLRKDTGRFSVYQAALNAQTSIWFGDGLWGFRDLWQCRFGDQDNLRHLHSGFFSTFIHGGIIGLGLLLAVMTNGLWAAWRLFKGGDPLWLTLVCAGLAGLVFDGESLASLATAPRFEGLFFWFPLLSAMALNSVHHGKTPAEK